MLEKLPQEQRKTFLSLIFFWQISKPNRKLGDWKTAFELNPFEGLEVYWLPYTLGRIQN